VSQIDNITKTTAEEKATSEDVAWKESEKNE
jgi:hypothetical protein